MRFVEILLNVIYGRIDEQTLFHHNPSHTDVFPRQTELSHTLHFSLHLDMNPKWSPTIYVSKAHALCCHPRELKSWPSNLTAVNQGLSLLSQFSEPSLQNIKLLLVPIIEMMEKYIGKQFFKIQLFSMIIKIILKMAFLSFNLASSST